MMGIAKTCFDRMLSVFFVSSPFEVAYIIVVFIAVNMIDAFLVAWVWYKSLRDKLMNISPIAITEFYTQISTMVAHWFKIARRIGAEIVHTSNISGIANLVSPTKTSNIFEDFLHALTPSNIYYT